MRAPPVDPRTLLDARDPAGVAALLGHLGYTAEPAPIPRDLYREFGLDPSDPEPRALHHVARHGDLAVLLLVVGDPGDRDLARRIAGRLHHHNRGARRLLIFADPAFDQLVFAIPRLGSDPPVLRFAALLRREPRRADLELLADLRPVAGESATELAFRHAQTLDREHVTRRFYRAVRRTREAIAAAWTGVAPRARSDRRELALLAVSRLIFLTFLQQKGWLDGDPHYLRHLCERAVAQGRPLYRGALVPLFFGALNTRPQERCAEARALGTLPFLNGGLFERYAIERRYPDLDAPDEPFLHLILDVLERYRFTVQEDTPLDHDAAVDPEMLGRVFEGLMQERVRAAQGAFYTPSKMVARLVDAALAAHLERSAGVSADAARALVSDPGASKLDGEERARAIRALRRVLILDPAVGSGAFLLAALRKIEAILVALDPETHADRQALRRRIVHENLYGVDKNSAAVRLCELRLWLALVVDLEAASLAAIPPLPNLDHKVRQGDTLLDPIEAWPGLTEGAAPPDVWSEWRRGLRTLDALKARYLDATGGRKERVARALRAAERSAARRVLDRLLERADSRLRELGALQRTRDLFGQRMGGAPQARAALRRAHRARRDLRALARRLGEEGELPFFSFSVHFAEVHARGGFDIVFGNPPWVRPHKIAASARAALRARYGFARGPGWAAGATLAGAGPGFAAQVDLAALFVERALELLRPDGVLAFWLPVKLAHALYGGSLRAHLVRKTTLVLLEDASRRRSKTFPAVTFPMALVARKAPPAARGRVALGLHPPRGSPRCGRVAQRRLPLWPDDAAAPWCLVPTEVRRILQRMQDAGPALGRAGFVPVRGIVTGANHVFRVTTVESAGPGLLRVTAEGGRSAPTRARGRFEVEVEADAVRPLLRGEDVRAWRTEPKGWILFPHDPRTGRPWPKLPPRLQRYLHDHRASLLRRRDLRPGDPFWTLFRVHTRKLGPCVAWRDLGRRLAATVIPGRPDGPVPLNTVYLLPIADPERAFAIAALLNSRIVSAFLTAFAERAAGGFHRFFAWTVACLPLPGRWRPPDARVARLIALGAAGTAAGGLCDREQSELEAIVADLYGLPDRDVSALDRFQAFVGA